MNVKNWKDQKVQGKVPKRSTNKKDDSEQKKISYNGQKHNSKNLLEYHKFLIL